MSMNNHKIKDVSLVAYTSMKPTLALLGFTFILSLIFGIIAGLISIDLNEVLTISLAITIIAELMVIKRLFDYKSLVETIKKLFKRDYSQDIAHKSKKAIVNIIKSLIIAVLLLLINIALSSIITIEGNIPEATGPIEKLFLFLFVVLSAPILEEIIFRWGTKSLVDKLELSISDKAKNLVYIAISSVSFGLLHITSLDMNGLAIFCFSALSGAIFATVYVKEGKLDVPIIAHITYNMIVFML